MIVFDLEWNTGYGRERLDEILQIGAVRLDRLGGRILETFHLNIRPSVHKKLGRAAKRILDMQVFLDAELTFPEALGVFRQWCGGEVEFATWGGTDMEVLRQNCAYWKLSMPAWEKVYDIQASFSDQLGTGQSIALSRAVEYCGIPDCLDCHNALSDAVYAAVVGEWLPGPLSEALPRRVQRLSREDYPPQPRQKVGPFPTWEEALDSREARQACCPQCGYRATVMTWSYRVPQQMYTDFKCPEHGWHLCRLSLTRQEEGTWCGRQTVPPLTRDLIWEFHWATKCGSYACKALKKKRKRRRRKRPARKRAAANTLEDLRTNE